uniref:Uncharacterized protein n=1 Tax=Candidatus Kentrum sp. TUN TaxID=2126343 RepID=A0A451AID9_9GAMM|nr:MAG: hypothetical protein BECKTUN1418F_GA0071002_11222 [Candidatus Kentron sp. TUN]VFK65823.1 MAG: hypothetical protein BECKTUN1418E_GA0071001_11141 [Candidatus Kentron sp. TUN]
MKTPSYRTEEGWARHVDRSISTLPDVVSNLEGNMRYAQHEISSRFSELNGGIREISSFTERLGSIQSQHTSLLSDISNSSRKQINIQQSISYNSSRQTEILSRIDRVTSEFNRISRRQLEVQERQLAVQEQQLKIQRYQAELQNMQLEQSMLQTSLQQIIARELQLQSRLLEVNRQTDLAGEKLHTIKDYLNSEISRIETDPTLPDIVKFLLIEKYIAFISGNQMLSNTLSFLEVSFEFAFGSILSKLNSTKEVLFAKVRREIDHVMLNLKYCALLDNVDNAANSLNEIEILRGQLSQQTETRDNEKRKFNICASHRVKNPKEYLGVFQRMTRGIFNKKARYLFRDYRKREKAFERAQERYNSASKYVGDTYGQIKSSESTLHRKGYPVTTLEFDAFRMYLMNKQSEFLRQYPYFEEIRAAYKPFPS